LDLSLTHDRCSSGLSEVGDKPSGEEALAMMGILKTKPKAKKSTSYTCTARIVGHELVDDISGMANYVALATDRLAKARQPAIPIYGH
jgi:hypothetical protein